MARRATGTVATHLIQANHSRKPTYPAGRVCKHKGCETVLSVYNNKAWCSLHDDDEYLSKVGKRGA